MLWHISIHQFWRAGAIREACRLLCVIHYSTKFISCLSLTMSVSSERWYYMRDTSWGSTCFRYRVCVCVWKLEGKETKYVQKEEIHVSSNMTFSVTLALYSVIHETHVGLNLAYLVIACDYKFFINQMPRSLLTLQHGCWSVTSISLTISTILSNNMTDWKQKLFVQYC